MHNYIIFMWNDILQFQPSYYQVVVVVAVVDVDFVVIITNTSEVDVEYLEYTAVEDGEDGALVNYNVRMCWILDVQPNLKTKATQGKDKNMVLIDKWSSFGGDLV